MSYPYFTKRELSCKCCGECNMQGEFMASLVKLREKCGFPFIVTSGYRCARHNKKVGGAADSAHVKGQAVDIAVSGERAYTILAFAHEFGMTGIGIKQKGPHEARFIHIDNIESSIRPTVWSY